MAKLSGYAEKLSAEAKRRYVDKIQMIGGVDPLCICTKDHEPCILPPVDGGDLVSYLILQTSYISVKQFKAHKSMEAYNQFANGRVKDVNAFIIGEKCVVTGRVSICGYMHDHNCLNSTARNTELQLPLQKSKILNTLQRCINIQIAYLFLWV